MTDKLRRSILALSLLCLSLAMFPSAASASHSWNGYHWARQSNPFTLKLGNNLNSTWSPILSTTSSDWTSSTVLNTTIVAGGTTARQCRSTLGQVEVCNNTYGNNGWLGIAGVSVSGSHITAAYVKLNDSYFNTPQYNTTAWRNLVSCQEVGHTFGLDHQDTDFNNANLGTCMDYSNDPSTNQHPNSHDYAELVTIYTHLDSTTTVKALPPAMSQIDFDGPGQWGKLVGFTDKGLTSVYELDFGGGNKIFTFVIWANPDVLDGRGSHGPQVQ
ncbi:MAG: hypothetical protein ABIS20_08110 [Thermoanaerobaculia bacterium]